MEAKYFKNFCKENDIDIKELNDRQIKRLKDTVGFRIYALKKELENICKLKGGIKKW